MNQITNKDYILNKLLYFSDETNDLLTLLGECVDYTFFKLGHSSLANKVLMKIGELQAKKVQLDKEIQDLCPSTKAYYERKNNNGHQR